MVRPGPRVRDCCALIAVKARAVGKARLAPCLPDEARRRLVCDLLATVIDAAQHAAAVSDVVIVSPERDRLPPKIRVFEDSGQGLNAALESARARLARSGFRRLMVLPADLPLLAAADLDALVEAGKASRCAIARSRDGGTNGLYIDDLADFRFGFGRASCRRHVAEARRLGIVAAIVRRPALAFDIDGPRDLKEWLDPCAPRLEFA